MVEKIDSQGVDAIPLPARADARSGSRHSRRGPEARADSMHAPPVAIQGMAPTPNRPQILRRRDRSAGNAEVREYESSRRDASGMGTGNTTISTARDSQPRSRQQQQQQQQIPPGDSGGANAPGARKLSSRSPMMRYVVLTLVLIIMGFAVRYLWRQLAGLAGAWLILAAARHWSGERQRGQQDASVTHRSSPEYARRNKRREGGSSFEPPSAAGSEQSTMDSTEGQEVRDRKVVEAGDDHAREKDELEWNGAFADAPSELRRYWKDVGPDCNFVVRGMNYMSDKKKIPSGPAAMRLVHVDFFAVAREVFHVASKGRCRDRVSAFVKSFEDSGETTPFLFILNILLPGTPVISSVMYWAFDGKSEGGTEGNVTEETRSNDILKHMLGRYAEVPGSGYKKLERVNSSQQASASSADSQQDATPGSAGDVVDSGGSGDGGAESSKMSPESSGAAGGEGHSSEAAEAPSGGVEVAAGVEVEEDSEKQDGAGRLPLEDFRNQRFKLIPNIVEGPFIVRRAVGNKPALLGRKLTQRYFRGPGYVETDVDVGSSIFAEKIVSLCRGYARSLTVELGVCLEGRCVEELPEKCIGVIRLVNLDMDGAEPLYAPDPKPSPPASMETPITSDERDSSVGDSGAAGEPDRSDTGAAETLEPVAESVRGQIGEVTARA